MPTKKELLLNLSLLISHKNKLEEELQQTNNLLKHAESQLEVNEVNPAPVRTDPRLEAKGSESESSTNGKRSARGEEASSPAKLQREKDPLELSAQEMNDVPPPNVDIGGVRRALVVGKINMNQEQKVVNESSKLKGKENHSPCSLSSDSSPRCEEQPPATTLEKPSNKRNKIKRESCGSCGSSTCRWAKYQ